MFTNLAISGAPNCSLINMMNSTFLVESPGASDRWGSLRPSPRWRRGQWIGGWRWAPRWRRRGRARRGWELVGGCSASFQGQIYHNLSVFRKIVECLAHFDNDFDRSIFFSVGRWWYQFDVAFTFQLGGLKRLAGGLDPFSLHMLDVLFFSIKIPLMVKYPQVTKNGQSQSELSWFLCFHMFLPMVSICSGWWFQTFVIFHFIYEIILSID